LSSYEPHILFRIFLVAVVGSDEQIDDFVSVFASEHDVYDVGTLVVGEQPLVDLGPVLINALYLIKEQTFDLGVVERGENLFNMLDMLIELLKCNIESLIKERILANEFLKEQVACHDGIIDCGKALEYAGEVRENLCKVVGIRIAVLKKILYNLYLLIDVLLTLEDIQRLLIVGNGS
jgi:hypothetical protein